MPAFCSSPAISRLSSRAIRSNSAIIISIWATRRRFSSTWKRFSRMSVSRDFIVAYSTRRLTKRFSRTVEDVRETGVTLADGGCFFLTLIEECVEGRKKSDRLVDFRRRSGPVGAEADQFLHVGVGGQHLLGFLYDRPEDRIAGARHGARDGFQNVNGRITAALGDLALHEDVAIENAAHGVGHRLVVVVALDQHGEKAGDGPLPGARPGPLEKARQLVEHRRRIALGEIVLQELLHLAAALADEADDGHLGRR